MDLSGCSPQARGPVNATLASANAAVMFAVMCACDEPFAANAGCYRPVRTIAPEGLVVNARHPAPVAHRIAATHRLLNAMFGALHQAVPDRIPAAYYGNSYVCTFQTVAADGRREVLVEIEIGGSGGHPAKDGVNAFASGMHNNSNIPVEMIESQMPLTVTRYGLLPDSGGDGAAPRRARAWCASGGWTARSASSPRTWTASSTRPTAWRAACPPSVGRLVLTRDGEESDLAPKADNVPLAEGDRVRLETSGGGGFGDPDTRDAAAVERDLALGYVGSAAADEGHLRRHHGDELDVRVERHVGHHDDGVADMARRPWSAPPRPCRSPASRRAASAGSSASRRCRCRSGRSRCRIAARRARATWSGR